MSLKIIILINVLKLMLVKNLYQNYHIIILQRAQMVCSQKQRSKCFLFIVLGCDIPDYMVESQKIENTMLANYNSARADYGTVYTLQCVLIVVLGGVNPVGGKGRISGVVLAIILLRLLETGLNRFPKISSYYISLIWGGVLILVMVLNYFTENNHAFSRLARRNK